MFVSRPRLSRVTAAGTLGALCGWACAAQAHGQGAGQADRRGIEILESRPHDPSAFTQGLLLYQGALYESTGRYGLSDLREVDPLSGTVRRSTPLDEAYFGEGLARVDDRLIQLTWQSNTALMWDLDTFVETDRFDYPTQGWGLCHDGTRLIMSDGTETLFFRDPISFELLDSIDVTLDGSPLRRLNELECVEGTVYANVWQTNDIVRIDPSTGVVDIVFDAAPLWQAEDLGNADVLNGIAFDPDERTFFVTGKLWPYMFIVDLGLVDDTGTGTGGTAGGTGDGDTATDGNDSTGGTGSTGADDGGKLTTGGDATRGDTGSTTPGSTGDGPWGTTDGATTGGASDDSAGQDASETGGCSIGGTGGGSTHGWGVLGIFAMSRVRRSPTRRGSDSRSVCGELDAAPSMRGATAGRRPRPDPGRWSRSRRRRCDLRRGLPPTPRLKARFR